MSTYAIGDVQGCYKPLMDLLDIIAFNPQHDTLWFTGDLVNRGPQSLEVLRFIKSLGKAAICVLGNHDMTLLAVGYNAIPYNANKFTFEDILNANDKLELLAWLKQMPFLYEDKKLNYVLVHAGIYPNWSLETAKALAIELQTAHQTEEPVHFYPHVWGNTITTWDPSLTGHLRLQFILNVFSRMRFCSAEGNLDFACKDGTDNAPTGFMPWFQVPGRKTEQCQIIFGHWAMLKGITHHPRAFALDTGCLYGGPLTALRLEDKIVFSTVV